MNLYTITCAPSDTDDDGIALNQTLSGAGNFDLTGAAKVTDGVATLGAAQKVTLFSAGNDNSATFTVTGTDADGLALVESIAGGSGGAVTTNNYFKTVTRVASSKATAGDVKIGFTSVAVSPTFKWYRQPLPSRAYVGCRVSGTINYALQECFTAAPHLYDEWVTNGTVTNKTANTTWEYGAPCMAIRLAVASCTAPGSVTANFCITYEG